jgi:hypothetical protein
LGDIDELLTGAFRVGSTPVLRLLAVSWSIGSRLTSAEDEHSHRPAPPASDKTKAGRTRLLGMFSTGLHREYLTDTKAALLAAASQDDFTVKYQATNLVVVGMDVADLVGLHFPFHNLAEALVT